MKLRAKKPPEAALRPESWVKDRVKEIFKRYDVFYWMPGMGAFGVSGVSDFIFVIDGHLCTCETKKGTVSETTKLQNLFIAGVRRAGGDTYVVNATNLAYFEREIQKMTGVRSDELIQV